MSIPLGARRNRGASILAALVLAAVLVVVGLAIESLNVNQNAQSLTAAATAPALQVPDCSTITSGANVVTAKDQSTAQATPVCTCTKTLASGAKEFHQVNYQVKAVLQSGTDAAVTVRSVGAVVSPSSPEECKVTTCKPWGGPANNCYDPKNAGTVTVLSGQLSSTLDVAQQSVTGTFTSDTVQALAAQQITLKDIGPITSDLSAGLNAAYANLTGQDLLGGINSMGYQGPGMPGVGSSVDSSSPGGGDVADQLAQLGQCGDSGQACPASSPASQAPVALNSDNTTGAPTGGLSAGDFAAGEGTCSITGSAALQSVGCGPSDNGQTEFYPGDATEQKALTDLGYTCTGDINSSAQGSVTCTPSPTTTKTPITNTGCPTCTNNNQPPGSANNNNTLGSGANSALSSLLKGLAQGLASNAATAAAQPCSTNSSVYAQQQQQYQTQLQQYQLQLQQYQLQMQINANNGNNTIAPIPPVAPVPCSGTSAGSSPYGTGTDGNACPAPPAQPDPSQCTVGTWLATSGTGNGCTTGWQCVPGSGGSLPTPQISCQPQVADVGMSIAISYSCTNAATSVGSGFSTGGATSGSATTTIATPPAGTNTATYGITCSNQGQTSSAQCSVQVSNPSIVLIGNPQHVSSGQTSSIGWITSGMQSCTVSSPSFPSFNSQNASNTSVNGVATTPPLTANTEFDLNCNTLGGETKSASTTVVVGDGSASAPTQQSGGLTVTSTADGTTVNHGSQVTITWQDSDVLPSSPAISIWLIDAQTGNALALIAGNQAAGGGTYTWNIPNVGDTCDTTSIAPCASDLVAGDSYGIEAGLYSPANAYLGGSTGTSNPNPTYADYAYTPTVFTVGQ